MKTKIFFSVFFLLMLGSIGATYYRYFVLRDYMIEAQAACDPSTENCFVSVCDPSVDTCTGDPEQDTTYYAMISRNAKHMSLCNPADEGCDALVCPADESDCIVTLCTPETVTDGVVCNDPMVYMALHPDEADAEESSDEDGTESEDATPVTDDEITDSAGE